MRPLPLDFRQAPRSAWRWVGWLLLAGGAAAAVALAEQHEQIAARQTSLQAQHDRLSERVQARAPRRVAAAPDPRTQASIRRANAIIDQLTVPWEGLFDAVEGADSSGLGLLAMTPTARDRSVRLSGEGRSVPDVLAYVERLSDQAGLGQVHLVGYSTVPREGASIVSFTLAATWKAQP